MGRGFCQKKETAEERAANIIKGYQVMRGYTRKTLARAARMKEGTLTCHINEPEKLRVSELVTLLDILKVPAEERTRIWG